MTHPKPENPSQSLNLTNSVNISSNDPSKNEINKNSTSGNDQTVPVDLNLIEFDTNSISNGNVHSNGNKSNTDDDLIFEEFARIRLKGHEADDTDV